MGVNSLVHLFPNSQVYKRKVSAADGHRKINFSCIFGLLGSLLPLSAYLTLPSHVRSEELCTLVKYLQPLLKGKYEYLYLHKETLEGYPGTYGSGPFWEWGERSK